MTQPTGPDYPSPNALTGSSTDGPVPDNTPDSPTSPTGAAPVTLVDNGDGTFRLTVN